MYKKVFKRKIFSPLTLKDHAWKLVYSPFIPILAVSLIFCTACFQRVNLWDMVNIDPATANPISPGVFTVVDVYPTSCFEVTVVFSAAVEHLSAETVSNYSIPGLSVSNAILDGANFRIVHLTTSTQTNSTYMLTVAGVYDQWGNIINPYNSRVFQGDAPPFLQSVSSYYSDPDYFVNVYYSEEVEIFSSEIVSNYSIPGLSINSATKEVTNPSKVTLRTSVQTSGASYMLTVSGVRDLTGNTVDTPNTHSFTGTGIVDTTPPSVVTAFLVNGDMVCVQFSEPVEQSIAESVGNYAITDNAANFLSLLSATRQSDPSQVWLDINTLFSKRLYTVTVSTNLQDLNGNTLDPSFDSADFAGLSTRILSARASAHTEIDITFTDPVEKTAAENEINFSIPGLVIITAVQDAVDHSVVHLTTSPQEDINYTLTVNGFIDGDSVKIAGDVAPYIENVSSFNNTQVAVYFSETVDEVSSESPSSYSISPSLSIFSATRDGVDPKKVMLVTASQSGGTAYTLTLNNVTDLNDNQLGDPSSMVFTGTGLLDDTNPYLVSAYLIDSNTVCIYYSEPMEQGSVEEILHYNIKDNLRNIVSISGAAQQSDPSKVFIDIVGTFSQCLYTITASSNVVDLTGNPILGAPENTLFFSGEGGAPTSFSDGALIVNPMEEPSGNVYSMITYYRGRVYIGPADEDNRVFRLKPDGTGPELVTFRFHAEGNTTSSLDPGPDGETGIDYLTGGLIDGEECLFIGPSKTGGNLNYIYFTSSSGSILDFSSMNLSGVTGGASKGVSAMIVYNNDLYIGVPDTGGSRPYILRVMNILGNPVKDIDVFNLAGDEMTRIGTNGSPEKNESGTVGLDSFGIFEGMLYLANGGYNTINGDGGILRSTTMIPRDYHSYPGDWEDMTPVLQSDWYNSPMNNRFSLELSKVEKLTPAEKAIPAITEFNGSLYIARNSIGSSGGPQLWKYDGSIWRDLVAANGQGITNMGNSKNTRITLCVTNGNRLYIGFDNDQDGIQVWRSASGITDPQSVADFEPVTTNGMGDSENNQCIFHGVSIAEGGTDYLWLLCGTVGGELRVYRTGN